MGYKRSKDTFQDTQASCTGQALVYLSMREHNRRELALKLKTKGYSSNVIEQTLDSLEDDGSLNEERYIQSFVRSNNRRHPEGKSMLSQRLAAKGTDRNKVKVVLDGIYDREYTKELIEKAKASLEKKGKATSDEELRANLMKLGFSSSDLSDRD